MKLQIFSDIHAENYNSVSSLWNNVTPQAPIAVIAGDIGTDNFESTLTEISKKFEHVICVLGNHDYYFKDISWKPDLSKIPSNVHILDRSCFELENFLFVGATLWSDFNNLDWFVTHSASRFINDFRLITNKEDLFDPFMASKFHFLDRSYIRTICELNRDKKKIVVVTHFLPSYSCVNERWKRGNQDTLNYYFSSNCDNLLAMEGITAWICGHTHDKFQGKVGETPVFVNPIGYPLETKHYKEMVIEI